jgi:hypothetical protein
LGNPLAGVGADVWMAATPSIVASNETATNSGDNITYTASVHKSWDWQQPIVVQNSANGSTGWATVTDYTFQYAGGVIVFNTARVPGTNAFTRISSGYYFNLTQLDDAHTWSLTLKANVKDTTPFQATGGYARKNATTKEGSGKIDTVRTDGRIFLELGNIVGLQLYVDKTNNVRWDGLGIVTGVDPKSDAKDVLTQAMSFDLYGGFYLRST